MPAKRKASNKKTVAPKAKTPKKAVSTLISPKANVEGQNEGFQNGKYITEELVPGWRQQILIDKVLAEETSMTVFGPIHRGVFTNRSLGEVMLIEDRIQLTTCDEKTYHEMFSHVPIILHGNVKNVLIVGGGDGATLREVMKHSSLRCTLVDIDATIIDFAKKFFPSLHQGAFDNKRATIIVDDGVKFIKETKEEFDVIIVDSTDPEENGPSWCLYEESFYRDCKAKLSPGGIVVTQNGHPKFETYPKSSLRNLAAVFDHATCYNLTVPTYMGGLQAFGWATDNGALLNTPLATLEARWAKTKIQSEVYTPALSLAAFVLPRWLQQQVDEAVKSAKSAPAKASAKKKK